MSITPLTLTGVSQYSSDLQSILTRSAQIAQIPVTALQNKDSDLLQQKTLLGSLNADVGTLASSLSSLGQLATQQAVGGTSSNTNAVTVSGTNGAAPGAYTIDSVTTLATAASERSLKPYTDSSSTPVSSTGTVQLSVGSNHYALVLTNNSLIGLRDQINSLGAGVTASILTTSGGNYLSIAANATGNNPISLMDNPTGAATPLLTSSNPGSDAEFSLNGIDIKQNSNIVNSVISGVTFQLVGKSASPTTITLASDPTQLSSALQTLVTSYNTVKGDLNAQVGPGAGLLSGDSIVEQLQNTLRQMASLQSSTGTIHSLADLGITFDITGTAAFNPSTFNALSAANISDAFSFIGSATTKLGGFSQTLQQYSDPVNGLIKAEQDGITREDTTIQNQVTTLTDRINLEQAGLQTKLQQTDALLAELESQQQSVTASLQGLNLVLYGKSPNS